MVSDRVQIALGSLADRVLPPGETLATAKARLRDLRGPLGPMWMIADRLWVGSHARDTAVRHFSDVDLVLVLEPRYGGTTVYRPRPTVLLDLLRRELGERLDGVDLRKGTSGVVARLLDPLVEVEVVPAFRAEGLATGCTIYDIPDGSGAYRRTSPRALANYVARVEGASAGTFRRLVRFIKWWAATQSTTMAPRGLYIELALAHGFASWDGRTDDAARIHAALDHLAATACAPVNDPTLPGQVVAVCSSGWREQAFVQATRRAAQRVEAAVESERTGRHAEALGLWARVFKGQVPMRSDTGVASSMGQLAARGA